MARKLFIVVSFFSLFCAASFAEDITITTYYPSPAGNYKNLTITNPDISLSESDFTQSLTKAGINIATQYGASTYTPGLFWSTTNNNATKPKAGVWAFSEDSSGTSGAGLVLGVSRDANTGITDSAFLTKWGALFLGLEGTVTADYDAADNADFFNGWSNTYKHFPLEVRGFMKMITMGANPYAGIAFSPLTIYQGPGVPQTPGNRRGYVGIIRQGNNNNGTIFLGSTKSLRVPDVEPTGFMMDIETGRAQINGYGPEPAVLLDVHSGVLGGDRPIGAIRLPRMHDAERDSITSGFMGEGLIIFDWTQHKVSITTSMIDNGAITWVPLMQTKPDYDSGWVPFPVSASNANDNNLTVLNSLNTIETIVDVEYKDIGGNVHKMFMTPSNVNSILYAQVAGKTATGVNIRRGSSTNGASTVASEQSTIRSVWNQYRIRIWKTTT